jgi:flagellar motor switch protein FliM
VAARTRARVVVDETSVQLTTYSKWTETLDSTTIMGLLSIPGADRLGVFQLDANTAETWANYTLGLRQAASGTELPLSDIIQEVLRDLIGVALEALQYSFSPVLAINPEFSAFNFAAHLAQAAAPDDQMLIVSLNVTLDSHAAPVVIALPASNITPALGAAGRTQSHLHPATAIANSALGVPVAVRLELKPRQIPAEQIIKLSVGDTIIFPHNEKTFARIMVGDVEVATGELATKSDTPNYVCEIATTHQETHNA